MDLTGVPVALRPGEAGSMRVTENLVGENLVCENLSCENLVAENLVYGKFSVWKIWRHESLLDGKFSGFTSRIFSGRFLGMQKMAKNCEWIFAEVPF